MAAERFEAATAPVQPLHQGLARESVDPEGVDEQVRARHEGILEGDQRSTGARRRTGIERGRIDGDQPVAGPDPADMEWAWRR